jgi:rubrerythrin
MPDGPRYDDDFYAWTQHQAAVLRSMDVADNRFDREHVAEEIEDLGKSERDAVRSQIRRILEHFLKLAYSPAAPPRFDWIESIEDARETLEDKLTATLRRDTAEALDELYERSRRKVARALRQFGEVEAADALPQACPYSLEDVFREGWYPDRPGAQP